MQFLAIIALVVSVVFAIINNEFKSASLWALWAIAAAVIFGSALPHLVA